MNYKNLENRRDFLKYLTSITAGLMIPFDLSAKKNKPQRDRLGDILPTRPLGNTGVNVTMLGTGGYHVGWTTENDAQEVIEAALEGGIRFFDTAESYGPHTSEIRYGKYLTPNYRDLIFLMTKTYTQSASQARQHLEESLKRMKTDYLDLWQIHSLQSPEDVDIRIDEGFLELMIEARESGKVRHTGFTGHADPQAHLAMLKKTSKNPIFETIQMPINLLDFGNRSSFIREVLPKAIERNMGVIAMKTLADGRFFPEKMMNDNQVWATDDPVIPGRVSIRDALYFAWSLPVSVLVTGAENASMMNEKIELAKKFTSLREADRLMLTNKVLDLAEKGEVEYYKNI